jgi:hypothetical protein
MVDVKERKEGGKVERQQGRREGGRKEVGKEGRKEEENNNNCMYWWECKMVHPLQNIVWWFFKKLKIKLPYDLQFQL